MRLDQTHFKAGGAPENVLGTRGILNARELYHDALRTLLLDDRLRDAELVDAIAERGDVLLQCKLERALLFFGAQRRDQAVLAASLLFGKREVGQCAGDLLGSLVARLGVAKPDLQRLSLTRDTAIRNALVPELCAHVASEAVELLQQRRFHVDLQQEMHAAAQIEAKIHRQCADCGKPGGAAGYEVQRYNV